ncbi:MAG: hypothetical protein NZ956_01220 [Candidatus Caldarchaeum sp.]|nr:hypothetical protein [Candidatus Caldarchaeum sp.]
MYLTEFTADEYLVLSWLQNIQQNQKNPVQVVDIDVKTAQIRPIQDYPRNIDAERLFEIFARLENKGLVKSFFDKKVALCTKCGKTLFQPHLTCPACGSENLEKVRVFVHSCGANISEHLLPTLATCPKCSERIESKHFVGENIRFFCNECATVFEKPESKAECVSCGTLKDVSELSFSVLKKYALTENGAILLEARDPSRFLMKKLLEEGFKVSENLVVKGVSGTNHVLNIVAVSLGESRVYDVGYFVDAETLLRFAVKRLDIEKTSIPGALGKIRWVVAAVEFAEQARKTAETFGIEIEVVKVD